MEDQARLIQQYLLAVLQHQHDLIELTLYMYQLRFSRARKRIGKRKRGKSVRPWIRRRRQFGLYDKFMVELRNEDHCTLHKLNAHAPSNVRRAALVRVGPKITKKYSFCRDPFEPGMKLALTLRHLASGNKFASMKFGWRVPHNTQSLVVREVRQAIIDEYVDEAMV